MINILMMRWGRGRDEVLVHGFGFGLRAENDRRGGKRRRRGSVRGVFKGRGFRMLAFWWIS